jgi:tetratricopeptide (TPR) repeat protein
VLSVVACALGMATKETMVAAPLLILLYDRTFVAGSFRAALRGRAAYYTALAATWVALIACVASSGGRGGTAGFGTGISPWRYALFQATAIVHYLRLSIWPQPLIFDYGTSLAAPAAATASCCVVMVGLLAATGWALVRRPAWGFLGTWFLLLLAPSSSIVPVATQVMAEHRMYLPLAAVIAGSFCAVASIRSSGRRPSSAKPGPRLWPWIWLPLWLPFALIAALLFALRTAARNADYQTARALWERNVADRPSNPRGYIQLALALSHDPALLPEAALQDEAALRLDPNDPVAHNNLGNIYLRLPGRIPDAAAQFREALRLNPISALYHANLAAVLVRREDSAAEAAAQFQRAVQLDPKLVIARNGLGNLLAADPNKSADAIVQFEAVLRLDPDQAQTRNNLAILYARSGRLPEAIRELERVLREHPEMTGAQANLEALRAAAR